jgi:hypothetical protein
MVMLRELERLGWALAARDAAEDGIPRSQALAVWLESRQHREAWMSRAHELVHELHAADAPGEAIGLHVLGMAVPRHLPADPGATVRGPVERGRGGGS